MGEGSLGRKPMREGQTAVVALTLVSTSKIGGEHGHGIKEREDSGTVMSTWEEISPEGFPLCDKIRRRGKLD